MRKLNITLFLIIIVALGLSASAKGKAVQIKKLKFADIGNPALAGSTNITEEGISLTAGGADVWGVKDEFGFSYFEKNGDFDLAARIESLTAPHLYTKAGLMAREELSENSRHIFFQLFPNNKPRNKNNGGFEFQYRPEKGGKMLAIYPAKAEGIAEFPVNFPNTWIRLKRTGDEFTGYCSADGKTWKPYTTLTLTLAKKIYLGIAVTSHNTKEGATSVFRDITLNK